MAGSANRGGVRPSARRWRAIVGLMVGALVLEATSCASAGLEPRSQETVRHRGRQRTQTFRVLSRGLGAEGDGYTFRSQRFLFSFDRAFDEVPGFQTAQERYERGKEAYAVLEGGYRFVRDLFGVEATKTIRVVIVPELDGDPRDAKTKTEWRTLDNKILEGSEQVTMYFGYQAFQRPSVLAHELTHALLSVYALPAWLNEGIATLVEVEYAGGGPIPPAQRLDQPLGLDESGYNIIETWRGDGNPLPFRSVETYGYAYGIVKELLRRYGEDLFVRFFALVRQEKPHLETTQLSSEQIVRILERLVGPDVRRFFAETLRFRVQKTSEP